MNTVCKFDKIIELDKVKGDGKYAITFLLLYQYIKHYFFFGVDVSVTDGVITTGATGAGPVECLSTSVARRLIEPIGTLFKRQVIA